MVLERVLEPGPVMVLELGPVMVLERVLEPGLVMGSVPGRHRR
jgi:hypothetical protein